MSSWQVPGYSEDRELGRGGFGRVVAATHDASGRQVAIKYLNSDLLGDPEFLAGFRDEARLLAELDVPQIVKILTYVEEPGRGAAIVMELVDGLSLHQLITQQGPTQPESALAVLKGSLLGLASAHAQGVVHRDYKPENVLVDGEGVSKLTDFGLAARTGHQVHAAGTPLYMAPEQWAGQPASPASDIYAATAVFFECLTGRPPFEGPLRHLREQHEEAPVPAVEVDEPISGLLERGMAKDPAGRPPDAAAFVFELESAAAAVAGPDWEERGRSQLAERVAALLLLLGGGTAGGSGTAAVTSWLGRHKAATMAGATLVVATTLVAGGIAVASNSGPHLPPPGNGITVVSQPQLGASASVSPTATPSSSPTPGAPVVTIALGSQPASPDGVTCGTAPPTFTVYGQITSSVSGKVSYTWIRSNGSQTGPQSVTVSAGQPVNVADFVTAASDTYSGSDTLQVSSPVSMSRSIPITVTCAPPPSHVISVSVTTPTPDSSDTCPPTSSSPPPNDTGSFTITVVVNSTGPVQLTWETSHNFPQTSGPGPTAQSYTHTYSGQTTYSETFDASFGLITSCGTYFFVQVTAKGSDGQSMSAVTNPPYAFGT
jgi:eukaryotic-like serine/threonine-protein kinase